MQLWVAARVFNKVSDDDDDDDDFTFSQPVEAPAILSVGGGGQRTKTWVSDLRCSFIVIVNIPYGLENSGTQI